MAEAKAKAKAAREETAEEEGVEEDAPFHMIDDLQSNGVNVGDINKLKAAGCYTIESIFMRTKKDLEQVKGLSEAKVEKILEAAGKVKTMGFVTGSDIMQKRKSVLKITTGSGELDKILGGGIESQSITEIFGEFRTGKTQLCHTLAVASMLERERGGGCGKVCYIDTEGTFRPERIVPIATRFGVNPDQVLDNILYARAFTSDQQCDLLVEAAARMVEDRYSLLIIDSSTALFRVDFSGRGELSERQQRLGRMLNRLSKIAEEFNVAIVITNQVMADPSGGMAAFVTDPKKPIGGHVMAHASTTRLYLRKGKGEERICKVYDSPCVAECEATFCLSEGGVCDSAG